MLVACGDDEEIATSDEGIPTATPMALDELPADIEEATLEISNAGFTVDELILSQGEPTILHVVNLDDETYRLRIGDDLVDEVAIPANTTTEVSFTTPKADTYDGELLLEEEESVVAEIRVIVQEAGGIVGLTVGMPTTAQEREGDLSPIEVVDQGGQAVVTVINQQTVQDLFGNGETVQAGTGTGFIIDTDGHIVTNWHVVTGGTSYLVILADGTEVEAELIGEDPRDDLAVVKIDPSLVPAVVPFGDSEALRPGQTVLAIGSPLGFFGNSVTRGIVSALNRDQLGGEGICQAYSDLIQHDAAINQGNSGGPLFNLRGEVVGVNTLGIPQIGQPGQSVPVQGLFFAVPSSIVVTVVDQIIDQGFISAPYLGFTFTPINPQIAAVNDLEIDHGLYVRAIEPGGPAAAAGLEPDDIILAVDGTEIRPDNTLSTMLLQYTPGDTVELTVDRGGEAITVTLTFGEVPQEVFEQCTLQGQP